MRLVTRSDFDGLMCGVLLKEVEDINEIVFAHPKDIQDGKLHITSQDILTNLPYDPNCGMWFDHHSSEEERIDIEQSFKGAFHIAPSAARVVYDYYGHERLGRYEEIMNDVDRVDSADLTVEDVTNPKGWVLLSYLMDPRTGLGKYHHYQISNYQLMRKMIEWIPVHPVEKILTFPDVKERVELYFQELNNFKEILRKNSKLDANVVITDLRRVSEIPTGNRFYIYTLFPQANVSVRIFNGKEGEFDVVAVGYSIFNRGCKTDLGELMSIYGGGGHKGSGTCQLSLSHADSYISEIISTLKANG